MDIHSFNTRFNHDLHIPVANLAAFQKGVWYAGIKVYNHLPLPLKHLSHDGFKFKTALKRFLLALARRNLFKGIILLHIGRIL